MAFSYRKHLVIPDTQCKPGVPLSHLEWAGNYIAERQPDVVIHLGDHWDMPSISTYDKGKKSFEGRRYKADIEAGNEGMALLMKPLKRLKKKPRFVFIPGNHEHRIVRAIESEAVLDGVIGWHDFSLDGWETQPYLRPISIDGVLYAHYFYNGRNGRPWTGTASSILRHVGRSFVMGHRQGLDIGLQELPTGERRRGIVAGSYYQHHEEYLGAQGNHHWRGLLVLHEVRAGDFDVMEVSLEYLKRRYS
jgi:hypothetical protein